MTKEIWKDIPNYEGIYQASNLGRIRTVDRKININGKNQFCNFKCKKIIKGKIMKSKLTKDEYYEIGLNKNGKTKCVRTHRLIAMTFIPNPNNYPVINHINHNRLDNRVSNLEWCTVWYNNRYSKARKVVQLDKNYNLIKVWECMSDAYRELGINVSNISNCCINKKYKTGNCYWRYFEEYQEEMIKSLMEN